MLKLNKKRFFILFLGIIIIYFLISSLGNELFYIQKNHVNLSEYSKKEQLSEEEYLILYNQTGISPHVLKTCINNDFDVIKKLQNKYAKKPVIDKEYIFFPTTFEEVNKEWLTPVAEIKKGDILITFSTKTLSWRHGHCGLILDEHGSMLEHACVGEKSHITNYVNWGRYPTFLVLRYKDEKIAHKAVEYAKSNLINIDYSIFSGITDKDMSDNYDIKNSNCSHIIWQAYKAVGVDLDSNKGKFVTPRDIAESKELSVVQVYGLDPLEYESRILY